jgi:hypothetical protein
VSDARIQLSGQSLLKRNGTTKLYHQLEIEIRPGRVTTSVQAFGERDDDESEPVSSDHPAVEQHYRDLDDALTRTAYRNRHISPIFKPERKRKHP